MHNAEVVGIRTYVGQLELWAKSSEADQHKPKVRYLSDPGSQQLKDDIVFSWQTSSNFKETTHCP